MRLIDADKLYYEIMQDEHHDYPTEFWKCKLANAVNNAPAVDPVKHGHWEMYRTYYRCSNCLCQDAIGLAPYCKNCGARMDNEVSE